MKVCTINFDSVWCNIKENVSQMETEIVTILEKHQDIDTVVFPELNTSGYIIDERLKDIAENVDGPLILQIRELSKKYKLHIIGGFIEEDQWNYYNSAFVVNKKGELVTVYRKNHLFSQSAEPEFYTPGNEINVFELDGIICGLYIRFDIRYPRLFEAYKKQWVELMFGLYARPKGRSKKDIFKFLIQARAHENQFFIVAIDQSGKDKNAVYESNHLAVNPLGEEIGESEGNYCFVEVDKNIVGEIENILPLKGGWKEEYKIQ